MIDEQIWCFDHISEKYSNPEEQCVRYGQDWICQDQIELTWVTGGCVIVNGHKICGNDFYRLAAQKCVQVGDEKICPSALGGHRDAIEP